ncbi:hypothetical protein BDZ91DRAFT_799071 [Kalaharituber pfeilii]|nr:hypothetical protein BDZ91DRAFT_799071 [Kalaharituber pfeilii]
MDSTNLDRKRRTTFFFTSGGFDRFLQACAQQPVFQKKKLRMMADDSTKAVIMDLVECCLEKEMNDLCKSDLMRRQVKDFSLDYIWEFSLQRLAIKHLQKTLILSTILCNLAEITIDEDNEDGIGPIPRNHDIEEEAEEDAGFC